MKTLKRTLVALAALTVASMSMTAVASAAGTESTEATTAAATDAATGEATTAAATDATTGEATTAAAEDTTAAEETKAADENKGDASASTVVTIGTVTVKPGTASAAVPVTISGNVGYAGTGIRFTFDSKLSYTSVEAGKAGTAVDSAAGNIVAVTSASGKDVTGDDALYTLNFDLPKDAKAGDVFNITGSLIQFVNAAGEDVKVKIADGAIKVADDAVATTAAATTAASSTKAAAKTVKKAGSSPATGEALPIAGAAAAVAVIGGVAVASRKRK